MLYFNQHTFMKKMLRQVQNTVVRCRKRYTAVT